MESEINARFLPGGAKRICSLPLARVGRSLASLALNDELSHEDYPLFWTLALVGVIGFFLLLIGFAG